MDDIYKNIEEYNPNRKRKILIVFDDMIADLLNHKKLNPILTELFIRGRKLSISLVFIAQSYSIIIHQILTLKTLQKMIFTKNVLQNHILF